MIDNYCERVDASFWSEPVNALTNLSFIVAGLVAISLLRKNRASPMYLWVLAGLMILIGIGSFLFHTFATPLTALADGLPIYAFQLMFLWCFPRFVLRINYWQVCGVIGLFLVTMVVSSRIPVELNGSENYVPAVLMLGIFAVFAARRALIGTRWLVVAAVVFAVSLTARTVDEWWCVSWPLGTHFIWHILNGIVVYLSWLSLFFGQRAVRTDGV
ncbi:MAG: ceramidase domain-containing protein [Gammaproteobacteria bacterium]|jgi:hypothetical protein|nr:ceramidase [Gammaproteobacteria bacterium]MDP7153358.1 ceramidase domain-containing protein [Gammaproteobacteria bacterium]MDP7297265.1 ceramidase domain-containing protein [Gammaproteobacteria bacterium]MDP7419278.1 ceramidase domain-containing protein [Gammaproteobacteria bacterium]MDP7659721.1 ceramidase domain-containing protein [Gammaproteobacteria bacterium]